MNAEYYNLAKLLNLRDLDGLEPMIYFLVGNRAAGKSFAVKYHIVKNFMKKGRKFLLLYRKANQVPKCGQAFFKDLEEIKFPGWSLTERMSMGGKIDTLSLVSPEGEVTECGYAISLKYTEEIKHNSSLFVDVDRVLFDEFQSETGEYLPGEIEKLHNILTSISRGGGKHVREGIKVFLVSNKVSLVNPYFLYFDIHKRLKPGTKFLRGRGWVLEFCQVEAASQAIRDSALGRLFEGSTYLDYATGGGYLLDDDDYIVSKPKSAFSYLATLKYNQQIFSLLYFMREGFYYVQQGGEENARLVLSLDLESHKDGKKSLLIARSPILRELVKEFDKQRLYFESLECKNAIFEFFKYRV